MNLRPIARSFDGAFRFIRFAQVRPQPFRHDHRIHI